MGRRDQILRILQDTGFQSVASLAKRFHVNVSTIRRDLDWLSEHGEIQRTHGGALPAMDDSDDDIPIAHLREKRAIGPAMAERLLEGQTVFIDTGSTCLEVAKALQHRNLTVVTHDLLVGMEILKKPSLNLVFIGGDLLPMKTHMWGPVAVDQLDRIRVNVAVFGASSVMDSGVYGNSSYNLELLRKIRSIASEAFFVADSTKFGREALYKVLGLESFTAGITDALMDPLKAASYPIPLIRAPFPPKNDEKDSPENEK